MSADISFEQWRVDYDTMSYQDQRQFYDLVAVHYPNQVHFTYAHFRELFTGIARDGMTVIETGGWRGELANMLLAQFPIAKWTNYEIAELEPACTDERYQYLIPGDYVWNLDLPSADVFIASHMIEHIKAAHLQALIDRLDVQYVVLEAPLHERPTDWRGYNGSHILEIGWQEISKMMMAKGYSQLIVADDFRVWQR